jgi:copper(I)-binding protein
MDSRLTRLGVVIAIVTPVVLIGACGAVGGGAPKLRVEGAWARPSAAGTMSGMSGSSGGMGSPATSAAYMVIANDGTAPDSLVGVACDAAAQSGLHETRVQNDVAAMVPVASIAVPAHGQVELKPGGYHVMLEGLKRELAVGDSISLTLQFEKSGTLTGQ